jgi:hypothetical protein
MTLTEEVLKAMSVSKCKVLGVLLVAALALGFGAAGLGFRSQAAEGDTVPAAKGPHGFPGGPVTTASEPPPALPKAAPPPAAKPALDPDEEARVLAALQKVLADAQQRLRTDREKQALDLIAKGLAELKKAEASDAKRQQGVAEFEQAFQRLQQQLSGTKSLPGGTPLKPVPPLPVGPLQPEDPSLGRFPSTAGLNEKAQQIASKTSGVIGTVSQVSPEGLILINLGEAAGLQKGQTIEVVRMGDQPRYLGRLEILSVQAGQSRVVGKMVRQTQEPVRAGDWVIPNLLPREPGPARP